MHFPLQRKTHFRHYRSLVNLIFQKLSGTAQITFFKMPSTSVAYCVGFRTLSTYNEPLKNLIFQKLSGTAQITFFKMPSTSVAYCVGFRTLSTYNEPLKNANLQKAL